MSELVGTMECPICGRNTPHEHSGADIGYYRQEQQRRAKELIAEEQQQAAERSDARAATEKRYADELASIHAKYKRLLVDCTFCSGLPFGNNELKYSNAEMFGLIVDYDKDTATCPSCGRILAEWE